MRTLLAALGVVLAGTLIAAAAEPETDATPQYRIDFRVVRGDGKDLSILAAPTVITVEGRPAYVRSGGQLTPPPGADEAAPIEYGTTVVTCIKSYNGQPYVDASFTDAQPDLTDPMSVRTSGITVRVFEKVSFGKPIVVPVKSADHTRCELTVSKVEPTKTTR